MIHQTTVDYLCNLINIDTTINSNNEIEGILYIKEVFDKIGIENKVYEPVSGKGNIIATIKGKSDDAIILHSHIDTANYNAENWLFQPQKATLVNNCIVGRGTLDCKGLVAIWMDIMKYFYLNNCNGKELKNTLIFICSCDEEGNGKFGAKWLLNNKTVSNAKCPFEIIQIGAIKLDSNLNILDTFSSYIKSEIYKDIHPFVKKMTGITNSDLKNAPSFKDVYKDFLQFIGSKNAIFGTWGTNDLKELHRNILFYNIPLDNLPTMYINIQQHASSFFNNPVGKCIGLQNAISILELEQDKKYHNALNDAYYTSLVFQKINNKNIKPETYTYHLSKKEKQKQKQKLKIDYDKLFGEFKNMLKRELTKEEKKVINAAYNMGRKNKYLLNTKNNKNT